MDKIKIDKTYSHKIFFVIPPMKKKFMHPNLLSQSHFSVKYYFVSVILICFLSMPIRGEVNSYFGTAFDQKSGQKVYTDNHQEILDGLTHTSSKIEYKDPSGKVIARKTILFSKNSSLPDFKLEDLRDGYVEGGEIFNGKYKLIYRKNKNEPLQEKVLDISSKSVADGGFDHFIKENWTELLKGNKIKFQFYAPSQLDSFQFYVKKVKQSEYEGRDSLYVKMEMDNLLLNIFIPPIFITYDIETKRIVYYEGISNINNSAGKSYFVKLAYNHFKK